MVQNISLYYFQFFFNTIYLFVVFLSTDSFVNLRFTTGEKEMERQRIKKTGTERGDGGWGGRGDGVFETDLRLVRIHMSQALPNAVLERFFF